jgi:hypothetical protein
MKIESKLLENRDVEVTLEGWNTVSLSQKISLSTHAK